MKMLMAVAAMALMVLLAVPVAPALAQTDLGDMVVHQAHSNGRTAIPAAVICGPVRKYNEACVQGTTTTNFGGPYTLAANTFQGPGDAAGASSGATGVGSSGGSSGPGTAGPK